MSNQYGVIVLALRFFANMRGPLLMLFMAVLGMVLGEWMTGDNLWKNYRDLHFGGLAGATTAALWTWLTFRPRMTPVNA